MKIKEYIDNDFIFKYSTNDNDKKLSKISNKYYPQKNDVILIKINSKYKSKELDLLSFKN